VQIQERLLAPAFLLLWGSIALIAAFQAHFEVHDSTAALIAGGFLVASLAVSRYILGLAFTTAPMLYLGLLGLTHLGLAVPWALGLYDISHAPWFSPYDLCPALALVTYSTIAYQIGVIVALRGVRYGKNSCTGDDEQLDNPTIFFAGGSIFLIGATMFVAGLFRLSPTAYYRLTYSETFRLGAESDPRFIGSGITLALIGLSLASAGASRKWLQAAFISAAAWLLMLFYFGFRGPALIVAVIVCVVALRKGIRFPRWSPWFAAAVILIAFPVVRFTREEPLNERSFLMQLSEFNVLDGPAEMGASIRPLVETVSLVGPTDYRYGRTYLQGLKAIVPNLAIRWVAPAAGSADDLPPSSWITATVEPWTYKNYGGMGFSAVAEPYMNFGLLGVIAYFFFTGFVLVRLEQASVRSSVALASWALVLGPLLWTTRNDFSIFFRPAVWGLLCVGTVWICSGGHTIISRKLGRGTIRFKETCLQRGATEKLQS
jgi:oligosaccharide repeat unit polymerase